LAASAKTIKQAVEILIEEVGLTSAHSISRRLVEETQGNKSYTETVKALDEEVKSRRFTGGRPAEPLQAQPVATQPASPSPAAEMEAKS
jgi:hypothetical protein